MAITDYVTYLIDYIMNILNKQKYIILYTNS